MIMQSTKLKSFFRDRMTMQLEVYRTVHRRGSTQVWARLHHATLVEPVNISPEKRPRILLLLGISVPDYRSHVLQALWAGHPGLQASYRKSRFMGTPSKLHDIEGCIIFGLAIILTESENSPASHIRSVEQVF
jgi:hypothetical protein